MENQKTKNYISTIFFLVLTYLVAGIAIPKFFDKLIAMDAPETEGIKIQYTVKKVEQVGETKFITAVYEYNGNEVEGEAASDRSDINVGDTYYGYILPDNIHEVLNAPVQVKDPNRRRIPKRYIRILKGYTWFINILYLFVAAVLISHAMKEHNFKKKGLTTSALLTNIYTIGDSAYGVFEFKSFYDIKHKVELPIHNPYADTGEQYTIRYYETKNGGCVADVLDKRLL